MTRKEVLSTMYFVKKFLAKKQYQGLKIFRHYLLKPNGKWRPIGAPGINTKVIHTALDLILRCALEQRFPKFQHGFRPGRSCATATIEVLQELKRPGRFVYEFDLKSYFNLINASGILLTKYPFSSPE